MSVQHREPLPSGPISNSISVSIERPIGGVWKRALDIVVAVSALILFTPLLLLTALLVKLSDGGPVFCSHNRVGYGGKPFGCIKFRTMRVGAEKRFEEYLKSNPEAAAEWESTRKLRFDPRVTFFGHALRKSSIDELPQLINILRGEMSVSTTGRCRRTPTIRATLFRILRYAARANRSLADKWKKRYDL
jgi:exopolysaccharide production protein ExoY